MEKLFWRVFKNKVIRNQILYEIKGQEVDFGKGEKWHSIGSRIDYNLIVSLEWMLEHKQYSMIIDKLNYQYIHITDDSIIQLIKTCTNEEVYKALFEKRREDLERVDLILESIKQDSVFTLSTFIKLYGGHETVSNSFKDYLLLDYAISIPSLKTANYLIRLNNNLNKYTESNLIKNALNNGIPSVDYKKMPNFNQLRFPVQIADISQTKTLLDLNNYGKKLKDKAKESLRISKSRNAQASEFKMHKLVRKVEHPINTTPRITRTQIDRSNKVIELKENQVLSFIEEKLQLSITGLIEKYKNDKETLPTINRVKEITLKHAMSLARNKYYKLNIGSRIIHDFGVDIPFFSRIPGFNVNYDLEFLVYILICSNFRKTIPNLNITITNKKLQELDQELGKILNEETTIDELFESHLNNTPELSIYYIDYQFHKGEQGLQLIKEKQHLLFSIFDYNVMLTHLFSLSTNYLSINGFKLFYEILTIHAKSYHIPSFLASTSSFNKLKQQFHKRSKEELVILMNYLESTQIPHQQQIKICEDMIKLLEGESENKSLLEKKIKFHQQTPIYKFHINWDLIYNSLVNWYNYDTLKDLIQNSEFFKTNFSSNDCSLTFSRFCQISQITGEIDLDKLDEFLKYRSNLPLFNPPEINLESFNEFDKDGEQRVRLINHLSNVKNIHLFFGDTVNQNYSKSFYKFFNRLFYNFTNHSTMGKIEDTIRVYSELEVNRINHNPLFFNNNNFSIQDFNLANYFFDESLINAIFNNDRLLIIKIVSYFNDDIVSIPEDASTPIQIIEYLYSRKLLNSFRLNLTKLILYKLINYYQKETSLEYVILGFVKMVLTHLILSNLEPLVSFLVKVSLDKEYYKILLYLYNNDFYNPKRGSNGKDDEIIYKIILEHDLLLSRAKTSRINSLLYNNVNPQSSISLFYHGYTEYIIEGYKKYNSPTTNIGGRFFDHSNLQLILNYSVSYLNLETFIKLYENIFEKEDVPFKQLLSYSLIYHRVDIIDFLFDSFEVTSTEYPLFLPVFVYGDIRIADYLITNQPHIFSNVNGPLSLSKIFKEALTNGHVGLYKLLLLKFPNFNITKSIVNIIIKNGYQNVIEYLHKIEKLIDLDYILNTKSAISSNGSITVDISDRFVSIINRIIQEQQQKKKLTTTKIKKRSLDDDNNNTIQTRQKKSKK